MDKTSKTVLNYFKNLPNQRLLYFDSNVSDAAKELNLSTIEFQACLRFLIENKYLEIINSSKGRKAGVVLSHTGLHHSEFKRISTINYLKDKWISIFALIVSIISLIISLSKL